MERHISSTSASSYLWMMYVIYGVFKLDKWPNRFRIKDRKHMLLLHYAELHQSRDAYDLLSYRAGVLQQSAPNTRIVLFHKGDPSGSMLSL